jgi:uncharacterized protein
MKLDAPTGKAAVAARGDNGFKPAARGERFAAPPRGAPAQPAAGGAMAAAFAKLQTKR